MIAAALFALLASGAQAKSHHHRHHSHHHRHQAARAAVPAVEPCGATARWCATYAPTKIWASSSKTRAPERPAHHGRAVAVDSGCQRYLGCGCHLAKMLGLPLDYRGLNLKWARDWLRAGTRAAKGCVGCVAVLSRGRGGHVGVVEGYDANGNPTIKSYANGRLGWTTTEYSARRVLGYVKL